MELDDDHLPRPDDIASLLVLEAGRLMEDASVEFASALPSRGQMRAEKLARLAVATNAAYHLMLAAMAVNEACGEAPEVVDGAAV